MTFLFVIKHLPNFDKKILPLFLVCLSISALTGFELINVLATPSLSVNKIVTPGLYSSCDYLISLDGTTPVAMLGTTKGGTPGDNIVGTAGQDPITFTNTLVSDNEALCLAPGTYSTGQTLTISGVVNVTVTCPAKWSCLLKSTGNNNLIEIGSRTCTSKATGCSYGIEVEGMYIDGTSQTSSNGDGQLPESVDARLGIEAASGGGLYSRIVIKDNFVYNTGSDGIYGFQLQGGFLVEGNFLYNGRGYWAAIHSHGGVGSIIGNTIVGWGAGCIRHGQVVTSNWCYASGKAGYTVSGGVHLGFPCYEGSQGTLLNSNWANLCRSDGIMVYGNDEDIIGNYISAFTIGQAYAGLNFTQQALTAPGYPILRDIIADGNVINGYGTGVAIWSTNASIISSNRLNRTTTPIAYHAPIGNTTVINNQYYNAVGKITNPFGTTAWGGATPSIAPFGTASAPIASTSYRVSGLNMLITSTAGTGVSISILDNIGTTIVSGLTTLTMVMVPVGWQVNFGGFSVAPTVTVAGM